MGKDFLLVRCVCSSSKEFVVMGVKHKGFASSPMGEESQPGFGFCVVCAGGAAGPVSKVYQQPFLGFS